MRALDQLDKLHLEHNWEHKETCFPELMKEYRELLYRIDEHFDACFSALRCLCPISMAKQTKFDDQFLDKAKLTGWKQFRDAVKPYRIHIGGLVNKLKHNQAELCSVFFHSLTEFRPGYYLRDVLPDGGLGPSQIIHSGNTAFSFTRDMMFNLWWLYRIGDLLTEAIDVALNTLHGYELIEAPTDAPNNEWVEVVRRCALLKPEFFPDESNMPYPRIIFPKNGSSASLEFPTSARGHKVGEMRVTTTIKVDFSHPFNKLPYCPEDS